jgi:hypothetical protein
MMQMTWMIPNKIRRRLLLEEACHTNFRSTIEFGRLCAMHAARCNVRFHEFAARYLQEEREILDKGARYALADHPQKRWAGAMDLGAFDPAQAEEANNHFAPHVPSTDLNGYLTYWANWHAAGVNRVRFVCTQPSQGLALTALCRFQPARFRGTGSVLAPHCTWAAVEESVRVGDTVLMHPGKYGKVSFLNLHGAPHIPLIFAPIKYRQRHRPVHPTMKSEDRDVWIEGKDADTALVYFEKCSDIRFCGMRLSSETGVGVMALGCQRVVLEGCSIGVEIPHVHDGCEDIIPPEHNTFTQVKTTFVRRALTRVYPTPFILVGYSITLGLYAAFLLGVLFVTAAMTQSEADEWIRRCVIMIVVKVFLVTPLIVVAKLASQLTSSVGALDLAAVDVDFDA